MAIFLVALLPGDDPNNLVLPEGSYVLKEVVDKGDLYGDEDYQDMGLHLSRVLGRRVHKRGWPKGSPTVPLAAPVPPGGDISGTVEPQQSFPEGTCQECGSMMVATKRGDICPNGCGESGPAPIQPKGLNSYSGTREDPKPTKTTEGMAIIPPTD